MPLPTVFRVTFLSMVLFLSGAATVYAAPPPPGRPAPEFTLRSNSGKNLKLSEYRGQVVMLNFWATWCAPCRQEMPELNRLYEQYRRAGFVLLGINVDENPKAAQRLAEQLGVRFPVLFDAAKQVSKRYDVDTMPTTLIVDRDGKVQYLHRGYKAGVEKEYESRIRAELKR